MDPSEILVVGSTGAGKTLHRAVAATLPGTGEDGGYSIRVHDPQDAAVMSQDFERLFTQSGRQRGAEPTRHGMAKAVDMTMLHKGEAVTSFAWLDYMGASLTAADSTTSALAQRVEHADAMLLYLPATALLDDVCAMDEDQLLAHQVRHHVARFKDLTDRLIARALRMSERLCVVVTITKFDLLVKEGAPSWAEAETVVPREVIRQRVWRLLPQLFGKQAADALRLYICPVSIGRDLGREMESEGVIAPLNVHRPIALGAFEALNRRMRHMKRRMDEFERLADNARSDLVHMSGWQSFVDDVFRSGRRQRALRTEMNDSRSSEWAVRKELAEVEAAWRRTLPLTAGLTCFEGERRFELNADGSRTPTTAEGRVRS